MHLPLDPLQSSLIEINSGKHYLQAPPGAGKTAVLTERLKHAIDKLNEEQIVCLTFTSRAADEMKFRAKEVVDLNSHNSRLFIGNFHAFCIHHLHFSSTVEKRFKHFALLNDDFYEPILMQSISMEAEIDSDKIPTIYLNLVDSAYAKINTQSAQYSRRLPSLTQIFKQVYIHILAIELLSESVLCSLASDYLEKKLPEYLSVILHKFGLSVNSSTELAVVSWALYKNFRQLKSKSNSLDFDDVLILALADLISYPISKRFIQVDEVQDLSPYQWEILAAISDEESHIFAVGDEQQSIYSFMGADILLLQNRVQNFTHHYLKNNYRSHPNVIQLLNKYRLDNWQIPTTNARENNQIFEHTSVNDVPSLLLGFNNKQSEIIGVSKAVAKILSEPDRSIGVLLSTNAQCDDYYNQLEGITSTIFKVSQNDLMQSPLVQDWFSTLKVLSGTESSHDWWRIVYRFSRIKVPTLTKNEILNVCNQLQALGFSIQDLLSPIQSLKQNCESGRENLLDDSNIKICMNAFKTNGIVIFDTETTGLDFETASIIQLAAIRVVNGEVVDTFDQYVNIELHEENGELKTAFYKSQSIHRITEADLQSGNRLESVLKDFFEFVCDSPVMAHNLMFDLTMLRLNICRLNNEELKKNYHSFRSNVLVDSLALSRQLYPDLPTHKLGDLLERFNLSGVNSHNALDDVKATASLVKHLLHELSTRIPLLDELISNNKKILGGTLENLPALFSQLTKAIESQANIHLSHTLINYMEFVKRHDIYNEDSIQNTLVEVNNKLIPWLDRNEYFGLFNYLLDSNKPNTERLLTLKESDLIDKSIHRLVISTIHRAKGLEFETVILPQVTDNNYPMWIPSSVSEQERQAKVNESCRLLYVGLSRPKNKLIVTFHHMAGSFHRAVSPFILGMIDTFAWVRLNIDS